MSEDFYKYAPDFRSRLSFRLLLERWRNIVSNGKSEHQEFFSQLLQKFSDAGKFSGPIDNYHLLKQHSTLIEQAILSLFPLTLSDNEATAITPPFSNNIVYTSGAFKKLYMDEYEHLLPLDPQVAENMSRARIALAYKIILKKYYDIELAGGDAFICAYPEPSQNIFNYFELSWDWQFVDVSSSISAKPLPANFLQNCHHVNDLASFVELKKLLPLEKFVFEGFLLLTITNVTERESASQVKEVLLHQNVFEDSGSLQLLKGQLNYYLRLKKKTDAGITSFLFQSNHFVPQTSSIVLKHTDPDDWKTTIGFLQHRLHDQTYFLLDRDSKEVTTLSPSLRQTNWQQALFVALRNENEVVGCLEIYFNEQIENLHSLISKLRFILPYFEMALRKKENEFQSKINRVVKDHFTALQPSVEWKFNEAAVQYLLQPPEIRKLEPVVFEKVYPLYASFDIRHSSTERNKAVQHDLLRQLQSAIAIFKMAGQHRSFPLLQALESELEEYINKLKHLLLQDEEAVHQLLKDEVAPMLHSLAQTIPDIEENVAAYFLSLEKLSGLINEEQKKFEETVTTINHYLSSLLEGEQKDAQKIFPHYFEQFATDGVEFDMYIGQSISPWKNFDSLYISNLRLWQLEVMALGARQLYQLKDKFAWPLETTQLILLYTQPISIRFRMEERKFDLDGVHHARYEVVKKRIDKAFIKNSNERLTKSGTIAIVYFNENDIQEYYRYIGHLTKKNLLEGEPERLDLEELQGVNGLKALRININMPQQKTVKGKTGEKWDSLN